MSSNKKLLSTKERVLGLINEDLNELELAKDISGNVGMDKLPKDELDAADEILDDGTSTEDYLSNPEIDQKLQQDITNRNKEMASVIGSWVKKIEEFNEFLNGMGPDSVQSILSRAQAGTLLAKLQASNTRKIANSAQELAALSESLKSFIGMKAISQG